MSTIPDNSAVENTDREIYRATPGDAYAPSIHVTAGGGIGFNVAGHVIVLPLKRWHALGRSHVALLQALDIQDR